MERLHRKGVHTETSFLKDSKDGFTCHIKIGQTYYLEFENKSESKIAAKKEVAKTICELFKKNDIQTLLSQVKHNGFHENAQISSTPEPDLLLSKVKNQQKMRKLPQFLDSSLAHTIYQAIVNQWKKLPLEDRRCKVLAAFVLTSELNASNVRVLSIGTGSKIITSEAISLKGNVVHDSHAEVIARRALVCLLYEHLQTLNENGFKDEHDIILQPVRFFYF